MNYTPYQMKPIFTLIFISLCSLNSLCQPVAKIFGISPNKEAVYEYTNVPGSWIKIGGPGTDWVWANGKLYGLSPTKDGIWEYSGIPDKWTKIGGPATTIYGGKFLCATNPETGDLYLYKNNSWTKIGGPGTEFVWAEGKLYGSSPISSVLLPTYGVWEYSGIGDKWNKIGGPAAKLYGGKYLCSISPATGDIYMYKNNNWTKIGGPGSEFVWANDKLYGSSPKNLPPTMSTGIWEYSGTIDQWSKIGGPAASIYGGKYLCATNPESGDVNLYNNGNWIKIGGPGQKFILGE